ncbi:MAG TPA: hypothetical protein VN519_01270 [Bryobacteraceae bacterium]|nr:hypothetical protein [Bryobacteraceae bacterium]
MERTISLPDDLLAQVEGTASRQGKNVDQWLEGVVRAELEDRRWRELLEYGRQKGRESDYRESDVPDVVREWRRENPGR